jgi:hypothetical protein
MVRPADKDPDDGAPEIAVTLTRASSRALRLDVGSRVWLVADEAAKTVPAMKPAVAPSGGLVADRAMDPEKEAV